MSKSSISEKFGFEAFADTEVYQQVNADIVRGWLELKAEQSLSPIRRVLDLATGKGTIPRLILENWPSETPLPEVICLDRTQEALAAARLELERFSTVTPNFVNASIEDFSLPAQSIDLCTWGNGIHYLDEKAQELALSQIKNVLQVGGWFAFNTAFHQEGRPAWTHSFYHQQVRAAIRNLSGVQRIKTQRPPASTFLPRSHYIDLLHKTGFDSINVKEITVNVGVDAMEKISSFPQYAAGALHGYPAHLAAQAMTAAVEPTMAAFGRRDERGELFISRSWLAIAARRPS